MKLLYAKSIISFILILGEINLFGDNEKVYQNDKRIILQEGLSQSRILSIIEDERGFMWFGTADGLNRWDGYTFKIFRNINNDSTSIPNNVINSIAEDMDGNIITGCVVDNKGNIWFTSLLSGIFKFRFGENPTAYYKSYLQ